MKVYKFSHLTNIALIFIYIFFVILGVCFHIFDFDVSQVRTRVEIVRISTWFFLALLFIQLYTTIRDTNRKIAIDSTHFVYAAGRINIDLKWSSIQKIDFYSKAKCMEIYKFNMPPLSAPLIINIRDINEDIDVFLEEVSKFSNISISKLP